jgi:hypothetical protein
MLDTGSMILKSVARADILNVDSNWILRKHEFLQLIQAPEVVRVILRLKWNYTGSYNNWVQS